MIFPKKTEFLAPIVAVCAIGSCVFFNFILLAIVLLGVSLIAGCGFFYFSKNDISQLSDQNSESDNSKISFMPLSLESKINEVKPECASKRKKVKPGQASLPGKIKYETKLMRAVKGKKIEEIKNALSGKVPCNFYAKNFNRESALDYAIKGGSDSIVILFLKKNRLFPFQSKKLKKITDSSLQTDTKLLLYLRKAIENLPVNEQNWWLKKQDALLNQYVFRPQRRRDSTILGMKVAALSLRQDQESSSKPFLLMQRRHSSSH